MNLLSNKGLLAGATLAVAGAAALSAGPSHAALSCTVGTLSSCDGQSAGKFVISGITLTPTPGNTFNNSLSLTFDDLGTSLFVDLARVGSTFLPKAGKMQFNVAIIPPSTYFTYFTGYTDVGLGYTGGIAGTFKLTGPNLATVSSPYNTLLSGTIPGAPTSGIFEFEWAFTGTRVESVGGSLNVPGPLPVLGAAAAFGFSRRLRNRLKTVA